MPESLLVRKIGRAQRLRHLIANHSTPRHRTLAGRSGFRPTGMPVGLHKLPLPLLVLRSLREGRAVEPRVVAQAIRDLEALMASVDAQRSPTGSPPDRIAGGPSRPPQEG